jgi:hypothetical protein
MDNIETTDIVLAATLLCLGYQLARIDVMMPDFKRGRFCFVDVPKLVYSDYQCKRLSVEPTLFNHHIKSLTTSVREIFV